MAPLAAITRASDVNISSRSKTITMPVGEVTGSLDIRTGAVDVSAASNFNIETSSIYQTVAMIKIPC